MISKTTTIHYLLLTTCYLLLSLPCFGNKPSYAVDKIPVELKENANAVIRAQHQEFNVYSIKEAMEKMKGVITIFNDCPSRFGKCKRAILNDSGRFCNALF